MTRQKLDRTISQLSRRISRLLDANNIDEAFGIIRRYLPEILRQRRFGLAEELYNICMKVSLDVASEYEVLYEGYLAKHPKLEASYEHVVNCPL